MNKPKRTVMLPTTPVRYVPRRLRHPRGPQYIIRYTGAEPLSAEAASHIRDVFRHSPQTVITDARFDVRRLR